MCGITGIYTFSRSADLNVDELTRMTAALHHRGPDEVGLYIDDRVALGHARLSIIGLEDGLQPIHNEDESLWIVYNGEIYNYPELKEDLIRRGHQFYTETDTEVVLHLFEEFGEACFSKLNGQFALAIMDGKKKRLVLARDRVGIRPLHFIHQKDRFLFASEIKALLEAEGVELQLDPIALDQLFTFWTTLPGQTMFEGVREVPPGHYAILSEGHFQLIRYWNVDFPTIEASEATSLEDVVSDIQYLLTDAVRVRLRADVPVGCYVSGGLDSSGITAIVKRQFDPLVKTFGLCFEAEAFDERSYQEEMVTWLQTDHATLNATNSKIGAALPDVLWHCEKSILRMGPVPLYLLSELVHENGYKVVLTGEGADEIFGGYNIFREAKVREFWARNPDSTLRPRLLGRLYPYIFDDPRLARNLHVFFGKGLDQPNSPFFSHLIRWQNTSRLKTFFSSDLRGSLHEYDGYQDLASSLPHDFKSWDYLARAQFLETTTFLSNYLLSSQGDRMAMAHSVEIRLPFLDHRLVEYVARIPSRWKIRGMNEKYVLKRALKSDLPPRITNRPKHPYRAPVMEALLQGGSRDMTLDSLAERAIQEAGLFDSRKVGLLLKKLDTVSQASELDSMALVGILSTQLIYKQFVGGPHRIGQRIRPACLIDRRQHPVQN